MRIVFENEFDKDITLQIEPEGNIYELKKNKSAILSLISDKESKLTITLGTNLNYIHISPSVGRCDVDVID